MVRPARDPAVCVRRSVRSLRAPCPRRRTHTNHTSLTGHASATQGVAPRRPCSARRDHAACGRPAIAPGGSAPAPRFGPSLATMSDGAAAYENLDSRTDARPTTRRPRRRRRPRRAPDLQAIERELCRLPDVSVARLVADDAGRIIEAHIIATQGKHPKQIVRDVQSVALAEFGLEIDRRVVSVVQLGDGDFSVPGRRRRRLPAFDRVDPGRDQRAAQPRARDARQRRGRSGRQRVGLDRDVGPPPARRQRDRRRAAPARPGRGVPRRRARAGRAGRRVRCRGRHDRVRRPADRAGRVGLGDRARQPGRRRGRARSSTRRTAACPTSSPAEPGAG